MEMEKVELRVKSSNQKKRILVIGSSNTDLVLTMRRVPSAGETLIDGGSYSRVPGGKGANCALAVSRLGADCVFCTCLGDDENGAELLKFYQKNGLDTRFIRKDSKAPTGLAVIMVEASGANRIIVYPGANMRLGRDNIEEAFMCYPDALLMNFEIPDKAVYDACEFAHSSEVPVFIDGGPAKKAIDFSRISPLEVFSPNESETFAYTGIRPEGMNDCLRAASALFERMKVKYVVIKLGARGCFVYDGIHYNLCAPYEVEAVDTTAAGDAFTAAMTVEYMRSGDIIKACRFANAVGALTVSKCGAAPSIPTLSQTENLITRSETPDK